MSTVQFIARCIEAIEAAGVDPCDGDAVGRALVEHGIRPDVDGAYDAVYVARARVAGVQGRELFPHAGE